MYKKNDWIYRIIYNAFFILLSGVIMIPLILLVISSFRPGSDLMRYGLSFDFSLEDLNANNYRLLFSGNNPFFSWFRNSFLVTITQVILALMLSACVGYGFGVYRFKFRNQLFMLTLIVMMIPTEVIMLPLYTLISRMDLLDNLWGVMLPYLVIPMLVFFFKQYAEGIPRDFVDAARIDGCTEYGLFLKIMVPLMVPAFAAMAINQGMNSWNNFLWPMIILRSPNKITLPVGLSSLMSPYGNNYDLLLAGSVIAIIPMVILFVAFQSYFIEGLTAGAIKG